MIFLKASAALAAAALALPLASQALRAAGPEEIHTGPNIFQAPICVGGQCTSGDTNGAEQILIKDTLLRITFTDTTITSTYPKTDWQLLINDQAQYGLDRFSVADLSTDTIPFTIEGGAPDNALWIADDGNIGIGTMAPTSALHVAQGSLPMFTLEQTSIGPTTVPVAWRQMVMPDGQFLLSASSTSSNLRLGVSPQADQTLGLGKWGNSYLSNNPILNPEARFHISFDDGSTQMKIEETIETQTARPLLNLVNHGRPDIIMANTATGGEWAFGAGTNFVLKNGAVGSSDGDKDLQLKLYGATGNLEITGQIITGGGTCGGGCDAVFTEEYDLPSIEDHAAEMFALGYLPNVGPTAPNQPINVSDKLGRMLNELEHAHIYIAELETRDRARLAEIAAQRAALEKQAALLSALQERLAGIEARLQ